MYFFYMMDIHFLYSSNTFINHSYGFQSFQFSIHILLYKKMSKKKTYCQIFINQL